MPGVPVASENNDIKNKGQRLEVNPGLLRRSSSELTFMTGIQKGQTWSSFSLAADRIRGLFSNINLVQRVLPTQFSQERTEDGEEEFTSPAAQEGNVKVAAPLCNISVWEPRFGGFTWVCDKLVLNKC